MDSPGMMKQEDDVIDLDVFEKTPADIVYEWDAKVIKGFTNYAIAENEFTLDQLLRNYVTSLKTEAINFENIETLRNQITSHMKNIYLYQVETNTCFVDNYLEQMEEILTFYCNLEIKCASMRRTEFNKRKFKTFLTKVCQGMVNFLTVYLLDREDHIFHVLIKIKTDPSPTVVKLLNILYPHFLLKSTQKNSDEAFCRGYIIFQKWKEILKPEDKPKLDSTMLRIYNRTKDSIKNNEVLKKILMPKYQSPIDVVLHLSQPSWDIANEYFKYIKSKRSLEDISFGAIVDDEECAISDVDDDEDDGFSKAYSDFSKTISNLSPKPAEVTTILDLKYENDDDDVQFVSITTSDEDVEIIDIGSDDPDIPVIIQFPMGVNHRKQISFLDSIKNPVKQSIRHKRLQSSSPAPAPPIIVATTVAAETPPTVLITTPISSPSICSTITTSLTCSTITATTTAAATRMMSPASTTALTCTTTASAVACATTTTTTLTCVTTTTTSTTTVASAIMNNVATTTTTTYPVSEHVNSNNSDCVSEQIVEKPPEPDNLYKTTCYYYGLVTPPSDDHHVRTTETSCVYANIIRPHSNENGRSDDDSLPSSHEETQSQNCTTPNDLPTKDTEQSNSGSSQLETDQEFDPEILPNTKKKCADDGNVNVSDVDDDLCQCPYMHDFEKQITISEVRSLDSEGEVDVELSANSNTKEKSPPPMTVPISESIQEFAGEEIIAAGSVASCENAEENDEEMASPPDIEEGVQASPDDSFSSQTLLEDDQNITQADAPSNGDILDQSQNILDSSEIYIEDHELEDVTDNIEEDVLNHIDEEDDLDHIEEGDALDHIEEGDALDHIEEGDALDHIEDGNVFGQLDNVVGDHIEKEQLPSVTTTLNNAETFSEVTHADSIKVTLPINGFKVTTDKAPCHPELQVTVDSLTSKQINPNKILYSTSHKNLTVTLDMFSEYEKRLRLRSQPDNLWKETEDLRDAFSGPVSKKNGIKCHLSPEDNFDLYDCTRLNSKLSKSSRSSTPTDDCSPAFETMDDFTTDFRQYYESSTTTLCARLEPLRSNGVTSPMKICSNNVPYDKPLENPVKKKRIDFNKTLTVYDNCPLVPLPHNLNSVMPLHSILKNSKREVRVNLNSFAVYGIQPTDDRLNMSVTPVLNRLPEKEINNWKMVTEMSRLKKAQMAQRNGSMMIQKNYKTSPQYNMVRFANSTLHHPSSQLEKGPTNSLNYTQKKTAKRKRNEPVAPCPPTSIKRPVSREAVEKVVPVKMPRKVGRPRKKFKDI